MSLYQVIEFPFRPRRRRLPPPRRRRPRRCRASCVGVAPPTAGCRAAALRRFLRWCRFKSAPSGALRGWAPARVPLLHRRVAAQKLKNVCALLGRRLVLSPPLFLVAMAIPRCGSVGRPRPLSRRRRAPRCACPLVGGLRLARCSSRARALQAASRPLRSRVRRAVRLLAPSPPRAGCGCAAGRPRLPPLGLALVGRGACGPPLAAPSGFAALSLPRRGPAARASPAPFSASGPRREKVFCRRCGGDGEKPLRRLICADSGSAQRAAARLFIARSYPSER